MDYLFQICIGVGPRQRVSHMLPLKRQRFRVIYLRRQFVARIGSTFLLHYLDNGFTKTERATMPDNEAQMHLTNQLGKKTERRIRF